LSLECIFLKKDIKGKNIILAISIGVLFHLISTCFMVFRTPLEFGVIPIIAIVKLAIG